MIYFITNRADHDAIIYKSAKIQVLRDHTLLKNFLKNVVAFGFDAEWSGRVLHTMGILMMQIGDSRDQFVLDCTKGQLQAHINCLNSCWEDHHIMIGHNLKADHNACVPQGLKMPPIWDTMLADQRLFLGSGLRMGLKFVYERRLKKFMAEDKDTRKDFNYMSPEYAHFLVKHLMYGAGDVERVIDIAKQQRSELQQTNQYNFVHHVEFPLVSILGQAELTGMWLDEVKWKHIVTKKRQEKFKIEKEMDAYIAEFAKTNIKLRGGKFTNERRRGVVIQEDLFGGPVKEIENLNLNNVNYNSPKVLLDVIDRLELPKPTHKKAHKEEKDSLGEEAIQHYLMDKPNTPIKPLLTKLLDYKGLQKFISSYGDKFLYVAVKKKGKVEVGYKNPITNYVHTIFKQCFTETGRLSSGEAKIGLYNSQQIPADKEIRACFGLSPEEIADGWLMSTVDLSGAELVIMAALANDQHLYQLGAINDDIHSPVATKCWRAVYQFRKANKLSLVIKDSKNKEYVLTEDFLIDKNNNKQLRTDFKPMVFGCVYGLKEKKGGETLNIPKEEARVIIGVIKNEFPATFKMVEEAARFALANGYVEFNKRSCNRRIFTPVADQLAKINRSKYNDTVIINYIKEQLKFHEISEIEGAARNCRIQGTQADMIKEAMVCIDKYIKANNIQAQLLLSVHDELVYKHKTDKGFVATKENPLSDFGIVIKNIMTETANKYLSLYSDNIRMSAAGETLTHWTK